MASPDYPLVAPKCEPVQGGRVLVTGENGSAIVDGPPDDVIESLSLTRAMSMRHAEDIRHRSTNFENWYKQKAAHRWMPGMCRRVRNVQGVMVPYYVIVQNGAPLFTVWFNLWPAAWIAGGPEVYERHDSLKSLYVSVERRVDALMVVTDIDASAPPTASTAPSLPTAPAHTPVVEIPMQRFGLPRSDSAASAAWPPYIPRVPAMAPAMAPAPSSAPFIKIQLYDGKRSLSHASATKMNLPSCAFVEEKCAVFDTVYETIVRENSGVAFYSAAAELINHLQCKIPPGVGKIEKMYLGASVGDHMNHLRHPLEIDENHLVCTISGYIVKIIDASPHV